MSRDLQLQIRMNASGNARAMFEQITNAGNATSRALAAARKEANLLDKQQKSIAGFQKQQQALAQNEIAIKKLTDEMRRSGTATAQQRRELTALHEKNRDLKRGVTESRKSYNELRKELKAAGIESKSLGANQTDLAKRMAQASAAADKQKARLHQLNAAQARYDKSQAIAGRASGLATNAAIKGTATMAAMSVPVRAYAQAETAKTDLKVAMMDKSGKVSAEYNQMVALANELGGLLPGTEADYQNMMTMLKRQGLSSQAILDGTGKSAAYLAVMLKLPADAAAEMTAKIQDSTKASEAEMMNIMDSLQRLYYTGVDAENIVPAFTKLAPALGIIGVKGDEAIKQLSPLVGMLDQAGLSGESAGNALRKVLTLAMDTDKVKKATEGTGIQLDFTNGKGEFGGIEKMYKELAKLKHLTTQDRLAILKGIWQDDAETQQAVNTMIENGQSGYDDYVTKIDNQASLLQRVNVQRGTLTNLWDAAAGSFTNFMASMGESIAPELKSTVEWIANINSAMSNWAARNPALAGAIMKTVAAVGLLLLAFAGIAAMVATFLGPFAFLRLALVQVGPLFASAGGIVTKLLPILNMLKMGLLAVGRAFLANPIVLVIAAIAAALYLLWKHWDSVKAALINGWNWIQQTFAENPILNFIFPVIGAARLLVNNWEWIKQTLLGAWNSIKQAFADNPILNFIFPAIGAARLLINNWETIAPFFQQLWRNVQALTSNVWNNIKMVVMGAWNALINWLRSTSAYQAIVSQWNNITSYLGGLKSMLYTLGAQMIGGLIDGIASKFGALKAKWNTVASVFNGSFKGTANVNSIAQAGAKMAGFSSGGYTGDGGRNAVAGIVHRGEGVLNQNEISRIGGESGFNRLRQWIRNGGMSLMNSGRSALAASGIGADSALLNKGMALLSGKSKAQPKMKFAEAISFGSAMQSAGGGGAAVAGGGDLNITININGAQNPTDVAAEVRRQLEQFAAKMRPSKSNFKDRD